MGESEPTIASVIAFLEQYELTEESECIDTGIVLGKLLDLRDAVTARRDLLLDHYANQERPIKKAKEWSFWWSRADELDQLLGPIPVGTETEGESDGN